MELENTLTTITEIDRKQLLTSGHQPAGLYHWWGNDSLTQWRRNCRTQPENWLYRTQTLNYTVNSQNYRAPEWDQVDWANSIVIYGCSFVFGDGIDDSETIPAQLSMITGLPVINLGAGGTSPMWQLHNQTLLLEHWPEPMASITIWPSASRCLSYAYDTGASRHGSWNMQKGGHADLWNYRTNPGTQLWMQRAQSRRLHRRLWLDATFYTSVAELLGCKLLDFDQAALGPPARDLAHPGPATARAVAEWLAQQVISKI